jgi:hypothetical protein
MSPASALAAQLAFNKLVADNVQIRINSLPPGAKKDQLQNLLNDFNKALQDGTTPAISAGKLLDNTEDLAQGTAADPLIHCKYTVGTTTYCMDLPTSECDHLHGSAVGTCSAFPRYPT